MRYWTYCEPKSADDSSPVYFTYSEDEILRMYKPYWTGEMIKVGKDPSLYTDYEIIQDWATVNWAWVSDGYGHNL